MLALGAAADTEEASLTHPPLACCAARFLNGHGPVPVCGRYTRACGSLGKPRRKMQWNETLVRVHVGPFPS